MALFGRKRGGSAAMSVVRDMKAAVDAAAAVRDGKGRPDPVASAALMADALDRAVAAAAGSDAADMPKIRPQLELHARRAGADENPLDKPLENMGK